MSNFDQRELRNVLGTFLTGVTVVTTVDGEGRQYGVTANSFSSVSMDPPLVLWSQSTRSTSFPAFKDSERFVVNILASHQIDISNRFAKTSDEKFAGVAISHGLADVPIIKGCAAWLECKKLEMFPGGDHVVYIGQVEKFERTARKPLAFGAGKYMVAYAHDLGQVSLELANANVAHIDSVKVACAALPEIALELEHTVSLAVWANKGPTIIRWEPSENPVSTNLRTGVVLTTTQSATGLMFAAFLPSGLADAILDSELQEGLTERARFETALAETRGRGLARALSKPSPMHQIDINAFSAPVFDASGAIAFVLTVSGRSDDIDPEWDSPVPAALRAAAMQLSNQLGCKHPAN
ncbi:flavin reductase [Caballeronia mineralivorans PML1(12)]|uniref:Flavin reductase n=1 Tax=Caballeronia mineralivorans PML1(12) TaxID=908627 RepID=A0A0J1G4S1_9BURK|nr:flavin reductase [Caballeronia mineralivorans]KLU27178.1 flavin reductase [Caballeronia mineralivorans PML1(12)]